MPVQTQATKSQTKRWITVLDTRQSTAKRNLVKDGKQQVHLNIYAIYVCARVFYHALYENVYSLLLLIDTVGRQRRLE